MILPRAILQFDSSAEAGCQTPSAEAAQSNAGIVLLRVEEAAQLATVRPSTIRAWLSQGRLPRVKVGRCTRILRRDLDDLIRAGRCINRTCSAATDQVPEGELHGN